MGPDRTPEAEPEPKAQGDLVVLNMIQLRPHFWNIVTRSDQYGIVEQTVLLLDEPKTPESPLE